MSCVIEAILIMEDESVKSGVLSTMHSIETQSLNFKQNIKITLFANENSSAKQLVDYYRALYPENIRAYFDDDIQGRIYDHIGESDSEYMIFIKAGDSCSSDLFLSALQTIHTHSLMVDAVVSYIRSENKVFNDFCKKFEAGGPIIHLQIEYQRTPVTLDGVFIKTGVVKEKIKRQEEGTFNELELLCDILSARKMVATIPVPKANRLIVDDRSGENNPMEKFMLGAFGFDYLLEKNRVNGYIPYFIQWIIAEHLFVMFEKSEDLMDMYDPPEYDFSEEWSFTSELLRRIDDPVLLGIETTRVKKLFIMELKYGRDSDADLFWDDLRQMYANTPLYKISEYVTRIDLMGIDKGILTIEGYCFVPKGIPTDFFEIGAFINSEYFPAEQVERLTDRYYYDRVNLWEKGFKLEIPLEADSYEIVIINKIHGHLCYKKNVQFMTLAQINKDLKNSYYYKDGYVITSEENRIICKSCTQEERMDLERAFQEEILSLDPERGEYINGLRDYYFDNIDKKEKQIWLIMDRPDRADDNAEAFFRYMVQKNDPGVECYFVLSDKSEAYEELSKIGKIVEPASDEHKKLHMLADYIISSQMAESSENPFNEDYIYFKDIYHEPHFIWLQHGVIHNSHGKTCGKYYKNFYGFVTSAMREHEYLSSEFFHYSQDTMWLTGMPRFDLLYNDEKNIITIMPTWRKYLTTREFDPETNTMIWRVNNDFVESEYYEFFNGLMNDERLLEAARKYGYKINFMPHVIFLNHAGLFKGNDVVTINTYEKRYRDIYAESKLIVTDYTSAAFDFAYMHKPLLYCQFDKEQFFAEHTVKKGYFDFEKDGFGEVSYDLDTTIDNIISYMKTDCKLKDKYRKRIDGFFKYTDRHCCDRIYDKIRSLEKKNGQ